MNINKLNLSKVLLLASALAMWGCGSSDGGGNGAGGQGGGAGSGGTVGSTPIADAGPDADVSSGFTVNLDGGGSSDPDGGALTYTWTQTNGPDVTGGTGALTGESPAFAAPNAVDTLVFELVVNNGSQDSPVDTVHINVFEDLAVAYFVDGDAGDDEEGTGSRDNPFASVAMAASELTTNLEDIYVKTRSGGEPYDETAANLDIPGGTSLYGGYTDDWVRDVAGNKTALSTNHRGVQFFSVSQDAWFSGFDLRTSDSTDASESVFGVSGAGDGSAALHVQDNTITTGDVEAGAGSNPGTNYGVSLRSLSASTVSDNVISAGRGGDGIVGDDGDPGAAGDSGDNATGDGRASGGASAAGGGNGGSGGERGGSIFGGNGGDGNAGSAGSAPLGGTIAGGTKGVGGAGTGDSGGNGNPGGRGVPGASGHGAGSAGDDGLALVSNGLRGGKGGAGSGGGGGGGGEANFAGYNGGGGGGGGEGGGGGQGGESGRGGGGSVGVWLYQIESSEVLRNTITSGGGGLGAGGGPGGGGGTRGDRGLRSSPNCDPVFGGCGSNAGHGGNGGAGGIGGSGGAGGGGPSYGVSFSAGMAPALTGNTIASGEGGPGGDGGDRGNGGDGGYTFAVYDRDPEDAFYATLSQNTLTSGTPGTGGMSGLLDTATAGIDGQSGTRNWQ